MDRRGPCSGRPNETLFSCQKWRTRNEKDRPEKFIAQTKAGRHCAGYLRAGDRRDPVGYGKSDAESGSDSDSSSESYDSSEYQIDKNSSAILAKTKDAGKKYVEATVFVGDSNTVRMNNYGLITLDQFVGQEGMGVQSAVSTKCVAFKDDSTQYTIPDAIAKMKPRRVIVTFGTNNADGSTRTCSRRFIRHISIVTSL